MLLIRLTIVIFYHLFDTNNLIGNYCMGKYFRFPPSAPSRLSFCASVQVSRDR